LLDRHPLDCDAQVVDLSDVLRGDGHDDEAAAAAALDDAVPLEVVQRLGQRRPADAEPVAQPLLDQPLAWAQLAGDDELAQLADHFVHEGRSRQQTLSERLAPSDVIDVFSRSWPSRAFGPAGDRLSAGSSGRPSPIDRDDRTVDGGKRRHYRRSRHHSDPGRRRHASQQDAGRHAGDAVGVAKVRAFIGVSMGPGTGC
jgi:hypothetical protein